MEKGMDLKSSQLIYIDIKKLFQKKKLDDVMISEWCAILEKNLFL